MHTMKIPWHEDDEFYQFSTKLGWFRMVILQKSRVSSHKVRMHQNLFILKRIKGHWQGVHSWNQPLVSMIEIPLKGTKVHCHAQRDARFDFETIEFPDLYIFLIDASKGLDYDFQSRWLIYNHSLIPS